MNRPLPLALLCLGVLPQIGCSELEPFLPKVRFDTLEVREVSFTEIQADFVFQVENPNPVQVSLAAFDYALALEEVRLLQGDNPDGFTLESQGSSELTLPIGLIFEEVWEMTQATRGLDTVGFNLAGSLGFDTPAGRATLPYDERGEFPALRTPKISLKGLRVDGLNLLGGVADLSLDLGIDNDHGATLFFDRFGYGVSLNGFHIAGDGDRNFAVEGATTDTVSLPIRVHLLQVGQGVVDAITQGGGVQVGFSAETEVDTPFGVIPLALEEQSRVQISSL